MVNLGRPKTINKNKVIEICCLKYWKKGINNFSFNEMIEYSGISKGSVYKLFGSEDGLKKETIKYYAENIMVKHKKKIMQYNDINKVLDFISDTLKASNSKPCYLNVSRNFKYALGPKTRTQIAYLESNHLEIWSKLVLKHIKHNKIKKKVDVKEISIFLYNIITHIYILKFNKAKNKEISSLFNVLKSFVKKALC